MRFGKLFFTLSFFLFLHNFSPIFAQDFNRQRSYEVQHYKIQVKFDRERKTVFGDTTVSLKPLKDNLKTLELDAAEPARCHVVEHARDERSDVSDQGV